MQPIEHYVRAKELLEAAAEHPDPSASETLYMLRAAQVKARDACDGDGGRVQSACLTALRRAGEPGLMRDAAELVRAPYRECELA